jgi:hypothetical protein
VALGAIKKELRVAFSRGTQPVWFRIAKWVIFVAVSKRLHGTRWFRAWILGGVLAGLTLHFVYRWKTRGWTEPWGGWDDI